MMRIAVFGAGGVGGYFGGRLAQAGQDVVFIARGAHLAAIRRDGLAVESIAGDFTIAPAPATDTPASLAPVDVVMVAVKAWQVPEAAAAMLPMLGPESFVLPLQNGVEAADQLAAVVGSGRVLGGLCRLVSFIKAPGRICHAGVAPALEFAERDCRQSERVAALRAAFEGTIGVTVSVSDDIEAALWAKFLFIASLSGVGALVGKPVGALRGAPESRALLEGAMREIEALARARGIALRSDVVERTLAYVDGLPETATASMQRDILEGRPSELEYQSGAVVRLARVAGVPAPVNEHVYRSLLPMEQRARGRSALAG
jgi:2-dehydropantoate 2-reductase